MAVVLPKKKLLSAAPKYLIPALRLSADWCTRNKVSLHVGAATRRAEEWTTHLYHALRATEDDETYRVRDGLARALDLATDEGKGHILAVLEREKIAIDLSTERLSTFELALHVLVHHPECFEIAAARNSVRSTVRFYEFFPKDLRPLADADHPRTKTSLRAAIRDYYRLRGQTAYALVDAEEDRFEWRFLFAHGRTPRDFGVIDDDEVCVRRRQVHDKHDLLAVDKATLRLAINAQFAHEVRKLRELIGEVFFDDKDHWSKDRIYSGAPLRQRGRAALSCVGVPGLRSVALRGFKIGSASHLGRRIEWQDREDLCDELRKEYVQDYLHAGPVEYMRFGVLLEQAKVPQDLIIVPPNKIYFDRRLGDAIVRDFLQKRGFADYPTTFSLQAA